ncbi:uncharacterized protein RSE6_08302 [Rhynchosporium secalis]|uniref:2EXR domain-containing protein n=1 Tax=Rhynchosporium secalis TaxID=38038 RepID=A0A1E1MF27_RHYSE|nr:uncharacterized protein RSE6_08302 [Rhynchosporium secalis]
MDSDSSVVSFHLFLALPTELRLKIWTYSLPQTPALLPRINTAAHLRRTCRESRFVHTETFIPFFLPSAREQFTYPISLYGNPKMDDTLYLDDINSLTGDFQDWIVGERRGVGRDVGGGMEGTGGRGRGLISMLAIKDEMWKQRTARGSVPRLEGGVGDLRIMIFNPETGLASLEVLTLVLTGGALSSGCRRGSGGSGSHCDGFGGKREHEEEQGKDERRLVACEELFLEDKKVGNDARMILKTLRRMNEIGQGWRLPELRFARIVVV